MECALDRGAAIGAERTEVLGGTGLWRARELNTLHSLGPGLPERPSPGLEKKSALPAFVWEAPILHGIDSPAAGLGLLRYSLSGLLSPVPLVEQLIKSVVKMEQLCGVSGMSLLYGPRMMLP